MSEHTSVPVMLLDGRESPLGQDIASAMDLLHDLWVQVGWDSPGYRVLIDAHDSLGRKLERIHELGERA